IHAGGRPSDPNTPTARRRRRAAMKDRDARWGPRNSTEKVRVREGKARTLLGSLAPIMVTGFSPAPEGLAMRPINTPGFPPEVRVVFEGLRQEVTFLHANWDAFKQLYGTEESVAALNQTAPGAFQLIGFLFRREFIMGISRLTDPKDS